MFFKALHFGCRRTIFDAKKYTIRGMSREMMKMDGRDSVEYQNWEKKGHNGHFRV